MLINKPYLFASVSETVKKLLELAASKQSYQIILHSLLFTAGGFLSALIVGITVAVIAYKHKIVEEFLQPLLSIMKSVPVASFIIIMLVWFGSRPLAVIVSFIIVFPLIYFSVLNGLKNTDKEMLEMARIYHMSLSNKVLYVYRLAVAPYLYVACQSASSMAWKSAIAAEVIGATNNSIGEQLYYSKIYLDSASLFAWTFVIIIISAISEKVVLLVVKKLGGKY